jgi:hypothetical protein
VSCIAMLLFLFIQGCSLKKIDDGYVIKPQWPPVFDLSDDTDKNPSTKETAQLPVVPAPRTITSTPSQPAEAVPNVVPMPKFKPKTPSRKQTKPASPPVGTAKNKTAVSVLRLPKPVKKLPVHTPPNVGEICKRNYKIISGKFSSLANNIWNAKIKGTKINKNQFANLLEELIELHHLTWPGCQNHIVKKSRFVGRLGFFEFLNGDDRNALIHLKESANTPLVHDIDASQEDREFDAKARTDRKTLWIILTTCNINGTSKDLLRAAARSLHRLDFDEASRGYKRLLVDDQSKCSGLKHHVRDQLERIEKYRNE